MKSDTPIDPSDPRISAFLLGELTAAVEYVDEGGKPLSSSGES